MKHEDYYNQLYNEAKAELRINEKPYGDYGEVANKMRGFLSICGEKKNKKTNELYREHIPQGVFGVSTDEIADSMGVDENTLMDKLTSGLNVKSREPVFKIKRIKLQKTLLEKARIKLQKQIKIIKEKYGCMYCFYNRYGYHTCYTYGKGVINYAE